MRKNSGDSRGLRLAAAVFLNLRCTLSRRGLLIGIFHRMITVSGCVSPTIAGAMNLNEVSEHLFPVTAVQGRLLHRRICNLYKRKQENSQPKSVWTSYNLTSTPARFASSCSSSKQPFSVYALTTI